MTTPLLIGLSGPARTGKDTIGEYLAGCYSFDLLSLAGPLKRGLATMLNLTEEQLHGSEKEMVMPDLGVSPRYLMQTLGTEWGRQLVSEYIWTLAADREIEARVRKWKITQPLAPYPPIVVTDIRFRDEADWLRARGGVVWHVRRPQARRVEDHSSEAGAPFVSGDHWITNSGDIGDLYGAVDLALTQTFKQLEGRE